MTGGVAWSRNGATYIWRQTNSVATGKSRPKIRSRRCSSVFANRKEVRWLVCLFGGGRCFNPNGPNKSRGHHFVAFVTCSARIKLRAAWKIDRLGNVLQKPPATWWGSNEVDAWDDHQPWCSPIIYAIHSTRPVLIRTSIPLSSSNIAHSVKPSSIPDNTSMISKTN